MSQAAITAKAHIGSFRNWASHSMKHETILLLPISVLCVLGGVQIANQSDFFIALCVLGIGSWTLLRCIFSWRRKVLITDQGLYLRRGLRVELIEYERIRQLSVRKWDGGWIYLLNGPRPIKVVSLSVGGREGEHLVLDWAFMPREQMRAFAEELGNKCCKDFATRVEPAPVSRWSRNLEWFLW